MNLSSKIRVAVLRGGPSSDYSASLQTGAHILSALRETPETYEPVDIFISKDGEWHRGGLVHEPHRALEHTDVVWNALHGSYGEDGQVQRILDGLQVPFTGSGALASTLAMNKELSKRLYQEHSLLTPVHELITEDNLNEDQLINIFRTYLHPVIVKPANASGSLGVSLAHTFDELKQSIKKVFTYSPRALVEEFVKGGEVSCAVINDAKGERIYALIPSSKADFELNVEENKRIEQMAKRAHEVLGLRHYSSSDFIVTPKRKIYILETNSLPALHKDSLTHRSLEATGWHPRDFVDHVLKLAL
ncbi:MAG: ATP-grasp domain-containing protein [bacterium]|nr:ATP-grasp domain-containing protein [bacterium]